MRFVELCEVVERFRGKSVAIVGSGPGSLDNEPGFVDSHDVVVRANNYRTGPAQGLRTDVHYSFYGGSIRKTPAELRRDGVTLCMNKCPNSKPIACDWHERTGRQNGIDFTYIYQLRKDFWFCDTFVPDDAHFLRTFDLLDRHIPSTGFAAILDVLACKPREVLLTGFDFFRSGLHNVTDKWRPGDPADPIGHKPELEMAWLRKNVGRHPIRMDHKVQMALAGA